MTVPDLELITVRAAERAGITRRSLARAAERGELVHLRRGVYIEAERWEPLDPVQRHLVTLHALFAVVERPITVSHWSAAALHGLPVPRGRLGTLEVTVPASGGRAIAGVRARAGALDPGSVQLLDGLPATSLVRTVLDVASTAPFAEGVIVADAALHRQPRWERHRLLGAMGEQWIALPERRANRRVPRVLEFADGDAESPGESVSRVTMHIIGLPKPVLQQEFRDARGFAGRTDFWFPGRRVIGEMDGRGKYLDPGMNGGDPARVVLKEKQREDRLRALAAGFVRWGWPEANDPARLAALFAAVGVLPIRM